jgi:hypothetical protein
LQTGGGALTVLHAPQHCPGGVMGIWSAWQTGVPQSMAAQFAPQAGQHAFSGRYVCEPGGQFIGGHGVAGHTVPPVAPPTRMPPAEPP